MPGSAAVASLFAALLLAGAAGFNPYLALMFVAALARYSGQFQLLPPYGFLSRTWMVGLAAVLFLANIFLDKMFLPGDSLATPVAQRDRRCWVGAIHDAAQMVLGPLVAALLAGATSRIFPPSWFLLAPMLGVLLAGLAYAGKRRLRRVWGGRWGPFTNVLLSALEDAVVLVLCLGGLLLLILIV